jgi:hypothetical protein
MNRGGAQRVRESESTIKSGEGYAIKLIDKIPDSGKCDVKEYKDGLTINIEQKRVEKMKVKRKVKSIKISNSEVYNIDFHSFEANVLNIYNSYIKDCTFSSCVARLLCLERSIVDYSNFGIIENNRYCSYIDLRNATCRRTNLFKSNIADNFVTNTFTETKKSPFPSGPNVEQITREELAQKLEKDYSGKELYDQIKSLYNNLKKYKNKFRRESVEMECILSRIEVEMSNSYIQIISNKMKLITKKYNKFLLKAKSRIQWSGVSKLLSLSAAVTYAIMYYTNIEGKFPFALLYVVSILSGISSAKSANTIPLTFASLEFAIFLFILSDYVLNSSSQ